MSNMDKNVLLRVNHPNGRKYMLTVEKKGKRIHTRWDESGRVYLKDVYDINTATGITYTWNDNGELSTEYYTIEIEE